MFKKITFSNLVSLFLIAFGASFSFSQTSYTFTSCGATGATGPTQAAANAAYLGTNLAGNVTVTGGIQYWTVPTSGSYKISAVGAQGGGANGGFGALIEGEFLLTQGQVIRILVGQQGVTQAGEPNSVGGGGGTFVVLNPATAISDILVIAGGGGGSASTLYPNANANTGNAGNNGHVDAGVANPDGLGGAAGTGGNKSVSGCSLDRGSGGGGFLTDGGSICQTVGIGNGGSSFLNGGLGGTGTGPGASGGFGGGGATWQTGFRGSGGGGGYSGGGAGQINSNTANHAGGGGGSYNNGGNPVNLVSTQTGNGSVVITSLQTFPNDIGISAFVNPQAPYCQGSVPVSVTLQNYGNNMVNSASINWSVNGTLQIPYSMTTSLDTNGGVGMNTITVPLGNATISGITTITAWSVSPNGSSDSGPGNDTLSITISPFTVNANTAFNLNCFGDSNALILTSVTNAVGPVTYSWSNGSTGQNLVGGSLGTYIVTATNGTCTDTASAVVSGPPAVNVTSTTNAVTCFGGTNGSASLVITGGTPSYSVNWPGLGTGQSISNLPGGTHNYVITDGNGCPTNGSVTVAEPTGIVVTSVITPVTVANDGAIDVTVSGGTPSYTYSWFPNGATTEDITGLSVGNQTIMVTDMNGCVKTLTNLVSSVVGLSEVSLDLESTLHPNPSTGSFSITLTNATDEVEIEIFDLLGKKVYSRTTSNAKTTLKLNERDGVYLVKITSGGQSLVKRLVLQK